MPAHVNLGRGVTVGQAFFNASFTISHSCGLQVLPPSQFGSNYYLKPRTLAEFFLSSALIVTPQLSWIQVVGR